MRLLIDNAKLRKYSLATRAGYLLPTDKNKYLVESMHNKWMNGKKDLSHLENKLNHHTMTTDENEMAVRKLIENWAKAVRNKDIDAILAFHSENLVMYDVPEPFQSVGLDAYRETWNLFFNCTKQSVFDILELTIIADEQVAFAFGKLECSDKSDNGDFIPLFFRLTIGLKKIKGEWTILHEHHSVPAAG